MPRLIAGLTVLIYVLPACIVALWWTALCSQLFRRVPAGDQWETIVSSRRIAQVALVAILLAGWALIFTTYFRYAPDQIDTFGLKSAVEWAIVTLQKGE